MGHHQQGNYPYPHPSNQQQHGGARGYGGPPEQHYPGNQYQQQYGYNGGQQASGSAPSPFGITPVQPQVGHGAPAPGPGYGAPQYGMEPQYSHPQSQYGGSSHYGGGSHYGGSQHGGSQPGGSHYGSHHDPHDPANDQPEDAVHLCGGATMTLKGMQEQVLNQQMADNFEVIKKLGQGGFGTVYLCRRTTAAARGDRKQTPEYFALKELSSPVVFKPGTDQDIRKCLPLDEAAIQQYMKHGAIVETYWADVRCLDPKTNKPLQISAGALSWTSLDNLSDIEATYTASLRSQGRTNHPPEVKLQMRIAMENCDLGALKDYLIAPGKTPTKTLAHEISHKRGSRIDKTRCALLAALDIAEAIKFMHKSATLHGDLKPHNILLVSDPEDEKLFRAKVSDFGLSHHMTGGQTHVDISQGTEAYLPMEVFQKFAITEATDVYSLGLLMWEIFYGIFWFTVWDAEKKRKGVRLPLQMEGYRPSCSASCPQAFASIIHDCLSTNPDKRPSAGDVVHRLIACMDQFPGPN